jgi:hypothetical protein
VTIALCVISPLRQTSGDTVPGRIGGAVLRCAGTFDLNHVDWIRAETQHDRMFYYMQLDTRHEFTSIFGPAPAVVGWLALVGTSDYRDETLRTRERWGGAVLVALAAALLVLAAAARQCLRRSALTGLVAVLSFAGAATLGQGLWQASVALPCVIGALAVLAWRERRPRLAVLAPALLALAVMVRPTLAPLALGMGLAWAWPTRTLRPWLVATAIAGALVAPIVVWNATHLNSPLPIGQWGGNQRVSEHVMTLSGMPRGFFGLLFSPARGLLWFAPIALLGMAYAVRDRGRWWLATGCLLQLLVMSAFFKWHGGLTYGPRLLAETTWVAIWLALAAEGEPPFGGRALRIAAITVTVVVGQLGLWRFDPDQWETRRLPERDSGAYWDFADSPITAAISPPGTMHATFDAPTTDLRCEDGELQATH